MELQNLQDVEYSSQCIFTQSELTPTKHIPFPTPGSKHVTVHAAFPIFHCVYYERQIVISVAKIILILCVTLNYNIRMIAKIRLWRTWKKKIRYFGQSDHS